MKANMLAAVFLGALLLAAQAGAAPGQDDKGLEIARRADELSSGYGDFTAELVMTLENKHGEAGTRIISIRTLEAPDDGEKSLVVFDSPRDVKGAAFLSHSHKAGDDDQWLYLPALKRVKRISSSNKSGSFMGSEFSYEDISSQEVEKYTHKWLRDEPCEGGECFVLERRPVDREYSGYTRQVAWIDKGEYRTWKVEYYDRKDSLLKTLVFNGYRRYVEAFWRPDEMFMQNHQNGKSTRLAWSRYRFGSGLSERDLDQNSLKRAR